MSFSKSQKGFTIPELVVVAAIIAMLGTLTLNGPSGIRAKSRDTQRLSDMQVLQLALELYYENNETYPVYNSANTLYEGHGSEQECGQGVYGDVHWCNLMNELDPYLQRPLMDPTGGVGPGGIVYYYYYDSDSSDNNQTYGIMARMEHDSQDFLVANDGGHWPVSHSFTNSGTYYELGQQPKYCQELHNPGDAVHNHPDEASWWSTNCGNPATNVCCGDAS